MPAYKKLIFVYNANSGTKTSLFDSIHKLFKPSTYDCKLCELTYGLWSEKVKWKKFRKASGIEMQFLHKDEYEIQFKSKFGQQYAYPIILIQDHYHLDIFMNANQINAIDNLESLVSNIEKRLKNNPK